MNTETPRTNAKIVLCNYGEERVCAEFSRELERENAALAEENRRLHVKLDARHNNEQLRHLRAEVSALRAALEAQS